tara:strand:+ start:934 stop:2151 length:1218 start_codon:yes stop_codon:yes gene_type:complete
MNSDIAERLAKNVGCSVTELLSEHGVVLEQQRPIFEAAGKTADEASMLCLRIAGQNIRGMKARLSRSGCEMYEGLFVSVPRPKDWAKLSYDKTTKTLNGLEHEARLNLVSNGTVALLVQDGEGWTLHYNPSLRAKQQFTDGVETTFVNGLPDKNIVKLNDGSYFYQVWSKNAPSWPNGGTNYRYGVSRPLSEPERTSLFYGRKKDSNDSLNLFEVKAGGDLSKMSYPTFVAGDIPLRMNAAQTVAYAKKDISLFEVNESVQDIFSGPPSDWLTALKGGDLITDIEGLDQIENFVGGLTDDNRWDALATLNLEVLHIDPREQGGFVVTLADPDIMSITLPTDLFVPKSQENLVTFGVGSLVTIVGQAWVSKEGEPRISITGWWCSDSVTPTLETDIESPDEGGWDE